MDKPKAPSYNTKILSVFFSIFPNSLIPRAWNDSNTRSSTPLCLLNPRNQTTPLHNIQAPSIPPSPTPQLFPISTPPQHRCRHCRCRPRRFSRCNPAELWEHPVPPPRSFRRRRRPREDRCRRRLPARPRVPNLHHCVPGSPEATRLPGTGPPEVLLRRCGLLRRRVSHRRRPSTPFLGLGQVPR